MGLVLWSSWVAGGMAERMRGRAPAPVSGIGMASMDTFQMRLRAASK